MDIRNVAGWDFWINLISLAVALLAMGFAVWTYFKSKQRKLITYEFEDENTNVVSVDRDQGENIKIYLDDQQVDEVRYQLIKIRNEGNMDVDETDYYKDRRLQIVFTPRAASNPNHSSQIILRAGIPEAAPKLRISKDNAKDHITLDAQNHYVALKNVPLHPGEWIKVKVLTLGKVDIDVIGRIKNGAIKPFVPTQILLTRRKVGYALLGALLVFLLYNSIGLLTAFVQGSCASGSIKVGGSSAFFDTANGYANAYRIACPIGVVNVDRTTSTTGLSDLASGTIQIANSEIPSSTVNPSSTDLKDNQVAVIPFTIVVNNDVTEITSLTPDQLLKIYNGIYRNWNEVDSRAPNMPIQVFGRPTTSGTYYTFTHYVLGGTEAHSAPSYKEKDTTDQVAQAVAQTSGAIGYVDEETAGKMTSVISPVEINGQAPTYASIEHNVYPFWAIEHMYTRKNPDSLAASFIAYVKDHIQTGDTFIRIQDMHGNTLQAHM
ncbi:MAG: substrate-binding domain-containing protein [Ktedonobacteraceae bacterium]|nr:substrate-binding domain-containing protein [Ktedonobacteraceae bacterium]